MQKAKTRAEVVTGGFLLSQSQGPKILGWNLFYKQKRDVYNAKLIKMRFNLIVSVHPRFLNRHYKCPIQK